MVCKQTFNKTIKKCDLKNLNELHPYSWLQFVIRKSEFLLSPMVIKIGGNILLVSKSNVIHKLKNSLGGGRRLLALQLQRLSYLFKVDSTTLSNPLDGYGKSIPSME